MTMMHVVLNFSLSSSVNLINAAQPNGTTMLESGKGSPWITSQGVAHTCSFLYHDAVMLLMNAAHNIAHLHIKSGAPERTIAKEAIVVMRPR